VSHFGPSGSPAYLVSSAIHRPPKSQGIRLRMLDPSDSDIWSSWQTKTAVFGALLTALLAVLQAAAGLMQRRHELRVRQAETGTKLVEEMMEEADDALVMLDSDQARFELDNGHIATITSEDVTESLRQPVSGDDDKATFVRESFDTLLYLPRTIRARNRSPSGSLFRCRDSNGVLRSVYGRRASPLRAIHRGDTLSKGAPFPGALQCLDQVAGEAVTP
jgi:hypothetical protein